MGIYDDKTGVTLRDSQVPFVPGILPPRLEKHYMNPIRFRTNYRIVPAYGVFCALCLILGLVLMEIDDRKFLPVFLILLGLMAVVTVWLLRQVPATRKAEIREELSRYDFDTEDIPEQDSYEFFDEGLELTLDANGLYVGEKFYWYSHLRPELVTSNRFNRVWIAVRFGTDPVSAVYLMLTPGLIQAVRTLPVPLENPEDMAFVLTHKENVFGQIYNSGTFRIFED